MRKRRKPDEGRGRRRDLGVAPLTVGAVVKEL
jgi:hypothetical protein